MNSFLTILRRLLSRPSTVCAPIPDPSSFGPSTPSASSRTNTPYADPPEVASTVSGPVALSTELEYPVNFSLSTIAAAIVSADTIVSNSITAVETAVTDVAAVAASVKKLVTYIPSLMETFENAYAAVGQADNGAGKLAGVLAALEAVAAKIATDWNDSIKAIITNIVAQAKAAFNAVASLGSAGTAMATASTTA